MKKILMEMMTIILMLVICIAFSTGNVYAFTSQWVTESRDYSVGDTIAGWSIIDWKNAGTGGYDWTVTGAGADSGNGSAQLWLFNAPNTASVTFDVESSAVSFMMTGDNNDGYAKFKVDGTDIGSFDMYYRGYQSLIVSDLNYGIHTIEVIQLGLKNPSSIDDHVAILGGAALAPEPISSILFVTGGMLLAGRRFIRRKA